MPEESEIDEFAPWLVLFLTLAGLGLRVLLLPQPGISLDEAFSAWISARPAGEILRLAAAPDHHPPLYYLLLHTWTTINGSGLYQLRLLSALFGAAAIPLIYQIGKRLSGAVIGVAAAVFLAISPVNIRLGQEARMYTLLSFNLAAAILALTVLLTGPDTRRLIGRGLTAYFREPANPLPAAPENEFQPASGWRVWFYRRAFKVEALTTDLTWCAFILFTALALLTHNTAVLFWITANAFVIGLILYRRFRPAGSPPGLQAPAGINWLIANIAILVLWSPWIPAFIRQVARVFEGLGLPAPTAAEALRTFAALLNENITGAALRLAVIWIVFGLVLLLGLLHYRKAASKAVFLAALIILPFLGELLASLRSPVFLDRTLIWTSVPLLVLLGAGIARLRNRFLIFSVIGILASINIFSAGDYFRWMQREDWNHAAGHVAYGAQSGDLVVFNTSRAQAAFDYYFAPYQQQYSIQVEQHGLPADLADSTRLDAPMQPTDLPRLASLLADHPRVWLVTFHSDLTDPLGLIPSALAAQYQLLSERDFSGVVVQLYQR